MPECCGEERQSKYCPECGKLLYKKGSLTSLAKHCRDIEKVHERGIRAIQFCAKQAKTLDTDHVKYQIDLANKRRDKWKSWADQLEAIINRPDKDATIDSLDCSIRLRKLCLRLGIKTIRELARRRRIDLMVIKNVGSITLNEVDLLLARAGLNQKKKVEDSEKVWMTITPSPLSKRSVAKPPNQQETKA